jgi:hypothetical protein
LGTETVEGENSITDAIRKFVALPNSAGTGAERWLRQRLDERRVPIETHLALAPQSGKVLGFYAASPLDMDLSKDDSVIVRLRRLRHGDSTARKQPGLEVCWIARDATTDPGFGRNLFDHAVVNAQRHNAVALVVVPHDKATEELWLRHYHFMCFKNDQGSSSEPASKLWYPVDKLVGGGWPS